ncbi:MAG: SpoIID/LytB domain-containing protein [Clostridiaceae bacterium]|nr:SpoIID/LytB domain-containing protein [Clostridiaceae bacterium]
MNIKKIVLAYILITAVLLTSFSFNVETVNANTSVPENIKVGLSFGQSQANIFTLGSETGMGILVFENGAYKDLLDLKNPAGIKVRRDEYYNIVNSKECEIDYVRVAKYEGEVIGPYHIQIGDSYSDIESARKVLNQVSSITSYAFLAYEEGWKVWAQLYLDESECLKQIKVMQNEISDISYSVVYPDRKRVQIIDSTTGQLMLLMNSEEKITVMPKEVQGKVSALLYKGKKYRGRITMQSLAESDVTLINELPFDHYLYGVVPSEMPAAWHIEALKAQAVAARNYALVTMGKHNDYGFDLCSSEHCQAYNGLDQENSSTTEAVNATKGKIITYNGKLISAFFHSSSGGHTEDSENVWGARTDYIRGVEDNYCLGSPYDNWTVELDRTEIKEKLAQSNIDLGEIIDIRVLECSPYGRVTKLSIKGTKETRVFEKEKIRSIIGTRTLKSIWYKLKTDADIFVSGSLLNSSEPGRTSNMYILSAAGKSKVSSPGNKVIIKGMSGTKAYNVVPNTYIFDGKGFGHGLGMSQYGAKGMAEAGNNYKKILEYYYKGAIVQ